MTLDAIQFYDLHPPQQDLLQEVVAGLSKTQKSLPPKLFYDERGSQLFDQICEQEEYYPTRTETGILRRYAREIASLCGDNTLLLELGSGASKKVRLLLEALRPSSYMGVDISKEFLIDSTSRLARDYPWLEVHATCADFCHGLSLDHCPPNARTVAFFPGSSIGNFTPTEAQQFLCRLASAMGKGAYLLIGVDLLKEPATLNAAYNDRAGVTADFNLNLLQRLNQELGADFDLHGFAHHAYFNQNRSRVEMHLKSLRQQRVEIDGHAFYFQPGETIHTENSYKYSVESFYDLAQSAGFSMLANWSDDNNLFSVQLFSC